MGVPADHFAGSTFGGKGEGNHPGNRLAVCANYSKAGSRETGQLAGRVSALTHGRRAIYSAGGEYDPHPAQRGPAGSTPADRNERQWRWGGCQRRGYRSGTGSAPQGGPGPAEQAVRNVGRRVSKPSLRIRIGGTGSPPWQRAAA